MGVFGGRSLRMVGELVYGTRKRSRICPARSRSTLEDAQSHLTLSLRTLVARLFGGRCCGARYRKVLRSLSLHTMPTSGSAPYEMTEGNRSALLVSQPPRTAFIQFFSLWRQAHTRMFPNRTLIVNPSAAPPIPPGASRISHLMALSAEQKVRLAKAKEYAKDQTALLLAAKHAANPSLPPSVAAALISAATHNLNASPSRSPSSLNLSLPAVPPPAVAALPVPPHLPANLTAADLRTLSAMSRVYVGSISFEVQEHHIRDVFGQFGSVRNVTMSLDATTGRHKGFCFVEFDYPESAEITLDAMNGIEIGGRTLKVGRPNNYNPAIGQVIPVPSPCRIFVANVNENVTEEMAKSIFEAFGDVKGVAFMPDALTRKHRGCGYVDFSAETAAASAIAAMKDGSFELGGLRVRTWRAVIGGPMPEGMSALDRLPVVNPATLVNPTAGASAAAASAGVSNGTNGGGGIGLTNPAIANALKTAIQKVQAQVAEENASLEENLTISASQRYSIMQKLLRSEESVPNSSVTEFLHMATRGEVDDELREDVTDECTKYGRVVRVAVWAAPPPTPSSAAESDPVSIFVQFASTSEAVQAKNAVQGRFFAGRQLEAKVFDEGKFKELIDKGSEGGLIADWK
ncbi:hypothetical protein DFJ73DRAFT_285600 [Zopfochytrium polystomum]|nr:hypothetical protein DFJ73DRAFT_285600 [Zopfochytrium polystomum]